MAHKPEKFKSKIAAFFWGSVCVIAISVNLAFIFFFVLNDAKIIEGNKSKFIISYAGMSVNRLTKIINIFFYYKNFKIQNRSD